MSCWPTPANRRVEGGKGWLVRWCAGRRTQSWRRCVHGRQLLRTVARRRMVLQSTPKFAEQSLDAHRPQGRRRKDGAAEAACPEARGLRTRRWSRCSNRTGMRVDYLRDGGGERVGGWGRVEGGGMVAEEEEERGHELCGSHQPGHAP